MSDGITIRIYPEEWGLVTRHGFGFLLLCLTTLDPTWLSAQQAADHVVLGIAAEEAHDLKTALQHYDAALSQDSTNYEANWRGALTLLTLGEELGDTGKNPERDALYRQAERYAGRAVKSNPAGADGHFALAASLGRASLTLGKKARIKRAAIIRSEALRTIALNPAHDGAYHILGRWNAEIMQISGFSRFFAKSFLGAGIFNEASWGKAIYNMEKAAQLDPGRIYHHLELAEIYAERKRTADARTQLHLVDSLPDREIMDSVYKRRGATLLRQLKKK
jgi:regulator of microtubule dynamics protein 3